VLDNGVRREDSATFTLCTLRYVARAFLSTVSMKQVLPMSEFSKVMTPHHQTPQLYQSLNYCLALSIQATSSLSFSRFHILKLATPSISSKEVGIATIPVTMMEDIRRKQKYSTAQVDVTMINEPLT
jgi:hypothetical protein